LRPAICDPKVKPHDARAMTLDEQVFSWTYERSETAAGLWPGSSSRSQPANAGLLYGIRRRLG
jgi:hypothetical protein